MRPKKKPKLQDPEDPDPESVARLENSAYASYAEKDYNRGPNLMPKRITIGFRA